MTSDVPGSAPPRAVTPMPVVLDLDDPAATDVAACGGKGAALARARQSGVPTVPGMVLTTRLSVEAGSVATIARTGLADIVAAFGDRPLAVRSSSVVEDSASSSAAGQFDSVLDVRGPEALERAVERVLGSRVAAGAADEPIAVLVQPMVRPDRAGVAFGVDPVSGRSDRRVIAAVRGSPEVLVGGEVVGSRWTIDLDDAVVDEEDPEGLGDHPGVLGPVAALLRRVEDLFGGPQDIEWAEVDGKLLLLQSRPVTSLVRGVPHGPLFGPGPVAETFPEALSPLEVDLWVPPLRDAVREAIRIAGTTSEHDLAERDLVVAIEGRVAIDLEVTGVETTGPRWRRSVAVGSKVRRLRSAWRVGRLRAALPLVADELAAQIDADLEEVPPLGTLTSRQLVALVERGRDALRSLHAHEVLLGLVADPTGSRFTGASVALRVLAEARLDGATDAEILRRAPVVLALVPPSIGGPLRLPSEVSAADLPYDPPAATDVQVRREALRLRVRWVHELTAQAAIEIGRRLVRRSVLDAPEDLRWFHLEEVRAVITGRAVVDPDLLEGRRAVAEVGGPLPARFQVSDRGLPIAADLGGASGGTGAGGGVGTGTVRHDVDEVTDGDVLVVDNLVPTLAPVLPRLAGLVSESGSVLSHLAILAREAGVPTVVGRVGARGAFPPGSTVRVDGQGGKVEIEEEGS